MNLGVGASESQTSGPARETSGQRKPETGTRSVLALSALGLRARAPLMSAALHLEYGHYYCIARGHGGPLECWECDRNMLLASHLDPTYLLYF